MTASEFARWLDFVGCFAAAFHYGKKLTRTGETGAIEACPSFPDFFRDWELPDSGFSHAAGSSAQTSRKGPRIMICSPHPDDECLTGTLPLRLRLEANATVLNLAMTLGSDPGRKSARHRELMEACRVVGFDTRLVSQPAAFSRIVPEERRRRPEDWMAKVETLADHFQKFTPDLVCMPHGEDGHPTHVAVSCLVHDALALYTQRAQRQVLAAASEFWRPCSSPKILVGIDVATLALLVAGVVRHRGEIARNPYHLRLPAKLMDTVRRGGELLAGVKLTAPDFCFGELYDLALYVDGSKKEWAGSQVVFPPNQPIDLWAAPLP